MTERDDRSAVLEAHVAECDECHATPLPLARIASRLDASVVPLDAATLSRRTLLRLQPELARRGAAVLWRNVAAALLLALLPLPAVLAYDAYLLRVAYELVSMLVPATLAACLICSYAALLVLVFAGTYATIPVLLANRTAGGRPALGSHAIG